MFVYQISNSVNDRLYVGLTTGSLQKRWREHKCAANIGVDKPLYHAMRKHGIDNFTIGLLYTATSFDDMRQAELRFIKELKTHTNEGGYNLTDHGYQHGKANQLYGENSPVAKLTEEMVAFIRDPNHWDKPNSAVLLMLKDMFGFNGSRDAVRDARRGDVWKHLNDKYPPVKAGQGTRKPPLTEEQRSRAKITLDAHRKQATKNLVLSRVGKRGPNAKLSEEVVKQIFYSNGSLNLIAQEYGISKKMALLIKQRKAHIYLTKDL